MGAQQKLQSETGNLVMALRAPQVRGRWGEVGLRRLVEMAGMLEHCDFDVQHSIDSELGRQQPDMVIHLPGDRTIIVDSKAPLPEFLSPNEMNDETVRARWLQANARAVRDHMTALSAKEYWSRFENSPDMVVLFLPTESVYFAVREQDASLVEHGLDKKIYLLTPATLIPVLHIIAFAWRRESLTENAEEIRKLGHELHTRMAKFLEHFDRVRKGLESAVKGFNDATGSLETRVMPAARRFKDLGATSQDELESVATIDVVPREIHAPEAKTASELPPFELAPLPPPTNSEG
jgi:DNA recombination protein RmuC